ncbi:MAG: magnesium transporter [Acidimicrobiales bacterium]
MPTIAISPVARLRRVVRDERAALLQGFGALGLSSVGDLAAGLTLGSITGTLDRLPGLLVLVPAAIGMRGNIFGALGSRLGTLIHTGDYRLSRRADTPVGQNIAAALLLSLSLSAALAVLAKALIVIVAVPNAISLADLLVVSMIGGVLSSAVVLGITVGVSSLSARRGWDLDNVAAPIVTAAGDMVTLPALFIGTAFVGIRWVTPIGAALCVAVGLVSAAVCLHAKLPVLRRIARESLPILLIAGVIDVVAGVTIEKRLESFVAFPALLVLVPPFLEDSGALGGILAARLSTRLHLGTLEPRLSQIRLVVDDIILTYLFAISVFTLLGLSSNVVSAAFGLASPGVLSVMQLSLLAGLFATTCAVVVAALAAVMTFRLGLDPDNHGIPLVTSSLDLLGAVSLIIAIVVLGIA